jgi:hypothetical protein
LGRIHKDEAEIYLKSIEQALTTLQKCVPRFASRLVKEAAPLIRDPRTAIKYVEKAAKRVPGITITKEEGYALVHRDPEGERLNQECLKACANPIVELSRLLGLNEDQTEALVSSICACKCQERL